MRPTVVPFTAKRAQSKRAPGLAPAEGEVVWPVADVPGPDQCSRWLDEVIVDKPFENVAVSLWTHHPNLRDSTEKLAAFITPQWPGEDGGSLLATAVGEAVSNVQRAIESRQAFQGRIVGVYLYGLLSVHEGVGRLVVRGQDRDGQMRRWNHFSVPLLQWAHGHGIRELVVSEAAVVTKEFMSGLYYHMLTSVASPTDAGYMAKHAPQG